jgi:dihydrodipicolinate synthase/N-acetylneuraminate lyase
MGAGGAILAVALFAPAIALDVWRATRDGDDASAAAAQARLGPLSTRIVGALGVPGVKAAMDAVGGGLRGGPPRPPLTPLSAPALAAVRDLIRTAEPEPAR